MDLFSVFNDLLPLSAAQIWLLVSALVFSICVVMMFVIFWQFRQHQTNLHQQDTNEPESEAMLIDMNNCSGSPRYVLKKKPVMVGRMPANDAQRYDSIVISDVTVGRCHATIEYDDGVYLVRDQGSVNGCYVNGQRVDGECRLQKGDFVKFHKFNFQFIDETSSTPDMLPTSLSHAPLYSAGIPSGKLDSGSSTILDIPKGQVAALSDLNFENKDHERTQVLARHELNREFQKVISERELTNTDINEKGQDITVRLFATPDDDETMRLYSKDLNGPPLERPVTDQESNQKQDKQKVGGKEFKAESLQLVPNIDKKVMEALGDFFSTTLDDIEIPSELELTEKGNQLAEASSITPFPNLKAVNERKNKEQDTR